jgi:hypothetical protein
MNGREGTQQARRAPASINRTEQGRSSGNDMTVAALQIGLPPLANGVLRSYVALTRLVGADRKDGAKGGADGRKRCMCFALEILLVACQHTGPLSPIAQLLCKCTFPSLTCPWAPAVRGRKRAPAEEADSSQACHGIIFTSQAFSDRPFSPHLLPCTTLSAHARFSLHRWLRARRPRDVSRTQGYHLGERRRKKRRETRYPWRDTATVFLL